MGKEASCVFLKLFSPCIHKYFSPTDKVIPRQLFEVPIQAAVGKRIIARETLSALRADVTAGLYGGVSWHSYSDCSVRMIHDETFRPL